VCAAHGFSRREDITEKYLPPFMSSDPIQPTVDSKDDWLVSLDISSGYLRHFLTKCQVLRSNFN
jgi:hypothetical protein